MKKGVTKNEKDISLKEYIDMRFNEFRSYMDIQFKNIKDSTLLAEENLNVRLESMNEFRNSMKDQAGQFVTRSEYNIVKAKNDEDIRELREMQAEEKGKASQQSVNIAYMIAIVGIIIGLISILTKL